ncbi:MAG: bifunctional glycosyltransferase/CDP-glycerol:glycerophosphate glycerophosphotransferase [Coriobacteriales bacterium]|jgi:CDP-glycerol glycerophosphotransferase (TagB/SpsB family)
MTAETNPEAQGQEPEVSIVCITYNQEDYIITAMESFLMQETNFPFNIIVSDDCSTDGTPDIIQAYADLYPGKVVPILRTENCGGPKNLRLSCQAATAKYIALCEGDDYWTDPHKLQKQYDVMEANPEAYACFAETEIIANKGWYLEDYYNKDAYGRMLIPSGIPDFVPGTTRYTAAEYISSGIQAHTSTLFYRWKQDMPFLPEYDELFAGDNAFFMMNLAYGPAIFIPEVMTAYRKTDDNRSAIAFKEWRENALTVQKSWIKVCEYLRDWYSQFNFDQPTITAIDNRMKFAMQHYLQQLVDDKDVDEICKVFQEHPRSAVVSLGTFLAYYRNINALVKEWGWGPYVEYIRSPRNRAMLGYGVRAHRALKQQFHKVKRVADVGMTTAEYWSGLLHEKDPNTWIITSFRRRGYLDNTRYLYEYACSHNPELNLVWITDNKDVYEELSEQGLPVEMTDSPEGKAVIRRASVAITDHFKSTDYNGTVFGKGTKVVQLWHGSGVKGMKNLGNTKEKHVVYSADIFENPADDMQTRVKKLIKRILVEPRRELHERYLMFLVANNQDRINEGGDWHIPDKRMFVNGTPRDALLVKVANGYETREMMAQRVENPDVKYRVIYAPTYRYDPAREYHMIDSLCEYMPEIDKFLDERDGEFVIRLHPHTWRNYSEMLEWAMLETKHIRVDKSQDVYALLGSYDALISDYSSIATDYLLFDRPMVFYRPDHEEFLADENDLRYDPMEYNPGPSETTWEGVVERLREYYDDPTKDSEWRQRICAEVFDPAVNDEHNSARVIEEIKRRLASGEY